MPVCLFALCCVPKGQRPSAALTLTHQKRDAAAPCFQALRSCRDMAHRSFLEHLRVRGEKLVQQPPTAPADLSVPPQVILCSYFCLGRVHMLTS